MPFTLLGIAVYTFYFGIYQTVPIYIACITSYCVICGSGLFRILANRGNDAAAARKSDNEALEQERAKAKHEMAKYAPPAVGNPLNDSLLN
mgnify:CR=1 FL=1